MFRQMAVALTLLRLASLTYSQVPGFGSCPSVKTQDSLDLNRYLGDWYEIYRFPALFEKGKCSRASYSLKDNGHILVDNREIVDTQENHAIGDAYRPDESQQAKLLVRFSDLQPYGDYWVVDTDYDTYTMVFSCGSFLGLVHVEFAWILARNMTLDASITQHLFDELASYKVDINKFIKTDQTGCPP